MAKSGLIKPTRRNSLKRYTWNTQNFSTEQQTFDEDNISTRQTKQILTKAGAVALVVSKNQRKTSYDTKQYSIRRAPGHCGAGGGLAAAAATAAGASLSPFPNATPNTSPYSLAKCTCCIVDSGKRRRREGQKKRRRGRQPETYATKPRSSSIGTLLSIRTRLRFF